MLKSAAKYGKMYSVIIMKPLRNIFTVGLLLITFIIPSCVSAYAETSDEAVISSQNDSFVPLYTTSPDSSLKNHSSVSFISNEDYPLFYAQTTALALIAGYLILFKVKGISHDEKMHRRKDKR